MAAEGSKKAEAEAAAPAEAAKAAKDQGEDKAVVPAPGPPAVDSMALVVVDKVTDKTSAVKNAPRNSNDRDIALAKLELEKRTSLIKTWEENEKAKAEHRAAKKQSIILSWENTKKAEYAEKMKNKKAIIHRRAEEKRATVIADRGEEVLKAEEMAARYRASGVAPKKFLGCFGA
ncbi:unnamed protein product [Urochloa decumbens]|uniref:Remorin n=1 Tax=Urochloa decumbens TaxID=240449 RepID=A0ABC9CJB3_9POAL